MESKDAWDPRTYRRPTIDLKTTLLIAAMVFGTIATVWAHHLEWMPAWAALLSGLFLMNLSFTAWHEPAHSNYSRLKWLNTFAGVLSSFASVYPGYFARRREHLIHHRFEGQRDKDPVYARIQTTWWRFPFQTLLSNYFTDNSALNEATAHFLPLSQSQKRADQLSNGLAAGLFLLSIPMGFWSSLLWAWLIPRGVIFVVHAYYICFLPHHIPGGGYQVYRIRKNHWLNAATILQGLHGIHHRWPQIPWHSYPKVYQELESTQSWTHYDIEKADTSTEAHPRVPAQPLSTS